MSYSTVTVCTMDDDLYDNYVKSQPELYKQENLYHFKYERILLVHAKSNWYICE